MTQDFQPKQISSFKAEDLAELQGDVSGKASEYIVSLMPALEEGDMIHDNACGAGIITEAIMASNPPKGIHIDDTDVNANFVAGCKAAAEKNGWPVTAATMSAQEITFPDNRFDQSYTAFAFHCIGDHDTAAKQIYRTLKPGGTAIASVWTHMPFVDTLQHAHWRTRGRDGPMPTLLPCESYTGEDLKAALVSGGFNPSKVQMKEQAFFVTIPDIKRWSQLAWSYLGTLPTGWAQNDEDKWEEAIADIVEQCEAQGPGISKNEEGATMMKMVACMGTATK